MPGVTGYGFRSRREIVPEQCNEPLKYVISLPLITDEFLEVLWMRSSLLINLRSFWFRGILECLKDSLDLVANESLFDKFFSVNLF